MFVAVLWTVCGGLWMPSRDSGEKAHGLHKFESGAFEKETCFDGKLAVPAIGFGPRAGAEGAQKFAGLGFSLVACGAVHWGSFP